jgi:hypothetical protein
MTFLTACCVYGLQMHGVRWVQHKAPQTSTLWCTYSQALQQTWQQRHCSSQHPTSQLVTAGSQGSSSSSSRRLRQQQAATAAAVAGVLRTG